MSYISHSSRTGRAFRGALALLFVSGICLVSACGSDDDAPPPTSTGQACQTVSQCYPNVKEGELLGDAVCLDKVPDGYCTHHCTRDSDCCAAAGECVGNHAEVCGPFESTGEMYCFLSCEDADVKAASLTDSDVYCQTYAGAAFHCRSTGGGSKNRKICSP